MATLATKNRAITEWDAFAKAKAFWGGRTPRQRVYLVAGAIVTLAIATFIGSLIADPDYKQLMTGLESADAQSLATELAAKKIPYKLSADGGSISVPADQLDAARLEMASHETPHSGRIGFEIFDKVSWGETEFDEKVNYQRALEGELERTIQTMENVKSARVHLVMATDSVFMDRERGAKASVTLRLRRGSLSKEQITAIMRLVAGAVEELKPADVTIVDADSNRPLSAADGSSGVGDELQQQLTHRLVETLAPVVGADRLHATVNVEYDNSSSEESQEKYDPTVSVPLNVQRTEETASGPSQSGGVPGTSSNVSGAKTVASTPVTTQGQSSKSETESYGVNRVTRHIVEPAGKIRRLSAAVVVDDAVERRQEKGRWVEVRHKRSEEELKLITELAQAAIGFDSARGDVVSIENLTFDRPATEDAPVPGLLDKTHKVIDQNASVLRYGALLGLFAMVYFLMVRPIQQRALAVSGNTMELPQGMSEAGLLQSAESQESLAQRALLLKKQLAESVRANPETSTQAIRGWLQEDKA
jgi:flagellar M-ring protein FliF